jgi:hypothetical protein
MAVADRSAADAARSIASALEDAAAVVPHEAQYDGARAAGREPEAAECASAPAPVRALGLGDERALEACECARIDLACTTGAPKMTLSVLLLELTNLHGHVSVVG